ncbi:TldD/PmbA family protein [Treponema pedis]|uniref:TldD/PmbA family protein n=1 Tax=Treponema pedis TaxID=409322 RepID=UPI0003F75B12|nr:TldD/PmbA family protein [Treponema pedis]QSI05165.1 TldD/PmbA family protein [Treponema pedis]
MKATMSQFLIESKPLLKKLIEELSNEFKYVSVLGSDSKGEAFSVRKNAVSVSDSFSTERGFVLRVYNGIGYSEYSFNTLDIEEIKKNIRQIAKDDIEFLKSDNCDITKYPVIEEEKITKSFYAEVKESFNSVTSEQKIRRLEKIMKAGFDYCPSMIDFQVRYEEVSVCKIFLSQKKDLEQSYVYAISYLIPYLKKGEEVKYSFKAFSGNCGMELLHTVEKAVKTSIDSTMELLQAEKIKPGVYEIICKQDVTGLIAHEAFGHGVEMDMFVKERAKAKEFINKKVASEITDMHDGAAAAEQVSSYLFDDEGTLAQDTQIIEKGILKRGICDMLSALSLGVKPTGNGKRESFERKAYTRMTNTFFGTKNSTLEEMIKSVNSGYLLDGYFSGMEDPKNWGIQCAVEKGYEIKDGKLTGKIVGPIFLTGYVPELLSSISMISGEEDFQLGGSGFCGKGYKEYVRTSAGGAYIKAVGRLG